MFHSARLKLTAWYLLIITLIISIFSLFIYRQLTMEVDRFVASQRLRIERHYYLGVPFPVPIQSIIDQDLVDDVKRRLLFALLGVDGIIVLSSGVLAYLLAGLTLKPIKEMVEEQYRFVSDSSHELRTPLTSLKSAMEVSLRDPDLTLSDAKKLIKENIDEVDKLTALSNNLLKLARFDQAPQSPQLQRQDIGEIVKEAVKKITPIANLKNINIDSQIKNFSVKGVKDNLVELFVILLDNAIKYSPNGSEVALNSSRIDQQVIIKVKDKGLGISRQDLPHIFDRFYRADSARTKYEIGGFGLGLSIAKKIVEHHNGSISVISKLNQGSTFIVRLPCFS